MRDDKVALAEEAVARPEAERVPGVPAGGERRAERVVDPAFGLRAGRAGLGGRVEARSRHGAGSAPGGRGASTRPASIPERRPMFRRATRRQRLSRQAGTKEECGPVSGRRQSHGRHRTDEAGRRRQRHGGQESALKRQLATACAAIHHAHGEGMSLLVMVSARTTARR